MDLGERKVAEGEARAVAQLALDLLDLAIGLPGVRALVVAVLEDQVAVRGAPDVVDRLVYRFQHAMRHGVLNHATYYAQS